MIHSYPKVYALGHPALKGMLSSYVLIEEKVDGSQFSFRVMDGELEMRSRKKDQTNDTDDLFTKAAEVVRGLAHRLTDGWVYRCEYLAKPKHNALAYGRCPENHLVVYDIEVGPNDFLNERQRRAQAHRIGLDSIPVLWMGWWSEFNQDYLRELLDYTSYLGGQKIEGVVVKAHNTWGRDGKILVGKYVSEAFKEVHRKVWGTPEHQKSGKGIVQRLVEQYRTPARRNKAVQHLEEDGRLLREPRDIGALVKEVQADIREECVDEIKDALWKWAQKDFNRGVVRGLPEWYKAQLAASMWGES